MSREVVGDSTTLERRLFLRLVERDADRTVYETFSLSDGSGLVWDHRAVPMSPFRMPEVGPNAPLLKRIIRYPAVMDPLQPVREQLFEGRTAVTQEGPRHAPVPMVFRENARQRAAAGPMSDVEYGPEDRDRPFGRARRAADERESVRKHGRFGPDGRLVRGVHG
jgi:hypothetical protein